MENKLQGTTAADKDPWEPKWEEWQSWDGANQVFAL